MIQQDYKQTPKNDLFPAYVPARDVTKTYRDGRIFVFTGSKLPIVKAYLYRISLELKVASRALVPLKPHTNDSRFGVSCTDVGSEDYNFEEMAANDQFAVVWEHDEAKFGVSFAHVNSIFHEGKRPFIILDGETAVRLRDTFAPKVVTIIWIHDPESADPRPKGDFIKVVTDISNRKIKEPDCDEESIHEEDSKQVRGMILMLIDEVIAKIKDP